MASGAPLMTLLLIALALFAQQLDPLAPVQAYTTADPNNPDRLGLATPDGRYSISLGHGCDGIDVGQNLTVYPYYNIPPWLTVALPGTKDLLDTCQALVYGRMDATPCFIIDDVCDVAAESDATD
jgi:hypothetical protein